MTAHSDAEHPHSGPAPGGRAPLITPTFVLAWLVNFFQYLLFYLLVTTVALYACLLYTSPSPRD